MLRAARLSNYGWRRLLAARTKSRFSSDAQKTLASLDLLNDEQYLADKIQIEGYNKGEFLINDHVMEGPIFVTPTHLFKWSVNRTEDISYDSLRLATIIHPPTDILLIGCGERMQLFDPELFNKLEEDGISVDFMDSRSALSTFNILVQEGRSVCAAILPVGIRD